MGTKSTPDLEVTKVSSRSTKFITWFRCQSSPRHFEPKTPGARTWSWKASTEEPPHSRSPQVTQAQLHLQGKACVSPQVPGGCGAYPALSPNCRRAMSGTLHLSGITVVSPFISPRFHHPWLQVPRLLRFTLKNIPVS